nr:unnamed protein product [Callosobruchus chinensis]
MTDGGKHKFGNNIREAYIKSKRKRKIIIYATKSGAGASHVKKYVCNGQLKFSEKVTEERSTEDSLPHKKDSSEQNEET